MSLFWDCPYSNRCSFRPITHLSLYYPSLGPPKDAWLIIIRLPSPFPSFLTPSITAPSRLSAGLPRQKHFCGSHQPLLTTALIHCFRRSLPLSGMPISSFQDPISQWLLSGQVEKSRLPHYRNHVSYGWPSTFRSLHNLCCPQYYSLSFGKPDNKADGEAEGRTV